MEKLIEIINTVLENRGKVKVAAITRGLDSLDLAELTVRVEVEYNIDIFEDGVVTTVGDILNKIA